MYDIDIEADAYMEEEGITTLRKWLYERKIAHVATPQAVDLFRWMLNDNPTVRFSAAQALHHPFIRECICISNWCGDQGVVIMG
jgi:serine/threonine protein kinase